MTTFIVSMAIIVASPFCIRRMRAKKMYELSRERKLILLSMHSAKPKGFRPISLPE